jgi:DNA polymerase-1
MSNWLEMSEDSGMVHTNWNQVRSERSGARTGRMSSNPNFMNIPTDFYGKNDGYLHPTCIPGLRELPNMRDYILPDEGCVWLNRDYSQQEPRILAHFEGGDLKDKYISDPTMDIHQYVADKIKEMYGVSLHRKLTKIINLGIIYGKGSGLLAKELNVSVKEAKEFKVIHAKAFPGIKELESDIKRIAKSGDCITTWGGRRYYCEEPVLDKKTGRLMTFEYKLLNYLIQGSAADCTKRSIINYHKNRKYGRFLITVHDENNVSAPLEYCLNEMKILKESMNGVNFDVPMLSDGKIGVNWGNLKDFKD